MTFTLNKLHKLQQDIYILKIAKCHFDVFSEFLGKNKLFKGGGGVQKMGNYANLSVKDKGTWEVLVFCEHGQY